MTPKELDKILTDAAKELPENDTDFLFYLRGDETDQLQFVANGKSTIITEGLSNLAHNNEAIMTAVIGIAFQVMKRDRTIFRRFQKQIKKVM